MELKNKFCTMLKVVKMWSKLTHFQTKVSNSIGALKIYIKLNVI